MQLNFFKMKLINILQDSVRVIDENDSRNLDELDGNSQNIGIYWTSEKKESTSIDDKNK